MSELVGLPGIEPGSHPPQGCILPLYYSPRWQYQKKNCYDKIITYQAVEIQKYLDNCDFIYTKRLFYQTTIYFNPCSDKCQS